jgi:hypothetical protein
MRQQPASAQLAHFYPALSKADKESDAFDAVKLKGSSSSLFGLNYVPALSVQLGSTL